MDTTYTLKSTIKGPPPDSCPSLDFWHQWNKCPATGSGHRLVDTCSLCGTEIVGDFETGDVGCQGAH